MVQSEIGHFTWRSSPVVRELGKANSYWPIHEGELQPVLCLRALLPERSEFDLQHADP